MAQERIHAVTLPKWGLEMTEGTVAAWHVEEGEVVASGADLVDIETDKIVNTLESEADGLLWRAAPVGETFPIGALIAVIADPAVSPAEIDTFVAGFRPVTLSETESPPETQGGPDRSADAATPDAAAGPDGGNREVNASPFARRRAAELGVDLATVAATGRGGRISERDVEAAAAARTVPDEGPVEPDDAGAATPAYETVAMTATRRSIARTLVQSHQTIPRFSVVADLQVDELIRLRDGLKAGADAPQPTLNDLFIKAAGLALADEPDLNAHVRNSEITRFHAVNICFAVATKEGLAAPVVRDAANIPVTEIAHETARLAAAARARTLTGADLEGGTFTVSNLGMFDIRQFDAIITPPQTAVLAIGAIRREPYEDGAGSIAFRSAVAATLSCDHRAIDGALAARFLQALRRHVESPAALAGVS